MSRFRGKDLKIKTHLMAAVVSLLFIFVCFELFLPLSSDCFLFKGAYGAGFVLKESVAPTAIVFDQDEYALKSNKSIFVSFEFEGDDNCSKQVLCWSENEEIALVYSTRFCEIIITGVSSGSTNIYVASAANTNLRKRISVEVSGFEPVSFDGLELSSPCYSLGDQLIYQTNCTIQYGQDLKLNYVVKNSSFVIIPTSLRYDVAPLFSNCIDNAGNFLSMPECVGKTVNIKVWSPLLHDKYGFEPITYSVKVKYPDGYGGIYLSTYLNLFFVYCFSFAVVGFMGGLFRSYFDFENKEKSLVVFFALIILFSYVVLILHAFVLGRAFLWRYWIVSPLLSALFFFLSSREFYEKLPRIKNLFIGG